MPRWLLSRLFDVADQSRPRFAFQGAVNWVRALAVTVASDDCSEAAIEALYSGVQCAVTGSGPLLRVSGSDSPPSNSE